MLGQVNASLSPVGRLRRAAKLAVASLFFATAAATAMSDAASASYTYYGSVDSDGYVPVYSTCYAGYEVGYYDWYSDGYATYGTVYINDCALQALGAGPYDRSQVVAHEMGHASGLAHSSDPYSYMYPVLDVTGT